VLAVSPTLPSSRDEDQPPIDVWGAFAALVCVSALVAGFIHAGLDGWSDPKIIGLLTLGILAGGVFAAIQLKRRHPLLDVRLFANRSFGVASFTVMMCFASVYGLAFLIIPYQQVVLGDSALAASLPMSATAFTLVPITIYAGRLTRRLGLRVIVCAGCIFNALGFLILLGIGSAGPVWVLFAATLPIGLGIAMVPCTQAIIRNVSEAKQGVAASVNHTTRELGTSLGVALFGGLLSGKYTSGMLGITEQLPGLARDAGRGLAAGALQVASRLGPNGQALADKAGRRRRTQPSYSQRRLPAKSSCTRPQPSPERSPRNASWNRRGVNRSGSVSTSVAACSPTPTSIVASSSTSMPAGACALRTMSVIRAIRMRRPSSMAARTSGGAPSTPTRMSR
jgi:hypothetical protein